MNRKRVYVIIGVLVVMVAVMAVVHMSMNGVLPSFPNPHTGW